MIREDDLNGIRFEGRPRVRGGNARDCPDSSAHSRRFSEPEDEVDPFPLWVMARASLDAQKYRAKPLKRRLPACLRALKSRDCAQARAILENHSERLGVAIDSLLVGVTEFFRDEDVFRSLEGRILQDMLRLKKEIRVWSAGCSNGAELDSVAMLLAEAGALKNCELLGTDCRGSTILEAEAGLYQGDCLKNVRRDLMSKYFRPEGNRHRFLLSAERNISWAVSDVLAGAPRGRWDLILCRNVAIYLNREAVAGLWRIIGESLVDGGYLVTGKAERPSLQFSQVSRSIYKKAGVA